MSAMELTEDQWKFIKPFIPRHEFNETPSGRPWREPRDVLEGILWILRTGARWQDLPTRFPPYQTCHRRFQTWVKQGVMEKILQALAEHLLRRGKLDLTEAYIDGTFSSAKKGVLWLVRQSAEKAARSWQSRTVGVFLSPSGLKALRRMKLSASNGLLKSVLRERNPDFSLVMPRTIPTRSIKRSGKSTGSNWLHRTKAIG
jgi:transposase